MPIRPRCMLVYPEVTRFFCKSMADTARQCVIHALLGLVTKMFEIESETELTCVRHGETAAHVHHVHLWHQFGKLVLLRKRESEHLIFMRVGREQTACQDRTKNDLTLHTFL